MKQIWPNYSYSPTTNVLTLTGLNIDRDQLLLVSAPERGRIMYNFADSTVTASAFTAGANTGLTLVASTAGLTTTAALVIYYDDQLASTTVTVSSLPSISGNVNVGACGALENGDGETFGLDRNFPVDIMSALPAGTNTIGGVIASVINFPATQPVSISSVTIGSLPAISGTVTANAGANVATAFYDGIAKWANNEGGDGSAPIYVGLAGQLSGLQDGDGTTFGVDRNFPISGTVTANVPVFVDGFTAVTGIRVIGAGSDGSLRIQGINPSSFAAENLEEGGGIPIFSVNNNALPISGTVIANTFAVQGTAVTTSNFTSTTASTVLANFNATREVLTIFNEGAGNLHVCAGATCTTIAYQVRLSSGDYYEVPNHQTTITHSAVFATAGTARVTQVS